MKNPIKSLVLSAVVLSVAAAPKASVIYTQPHTGSGSLYQSSVNGTDYDQLTWDVFHVTNATAITEVRWRGGYLYSGIYSGAATNWTISFYRDILNGYQPDIINPPFASYTISDNASETPAGTFGGTAMYDYAVTLPNPFQAAAGSNYWLLIKANQVGIPEWGIALGTSAHGSCFRRTAGVGDWWYYRASGDTDFELLTADGPSAVISASATPAGAGEIIGAGAYPIGSTASLTARPGANYGFVNWTEGGVPVSTATSYQFPVSVARSLVANFTPRYNVTVSASPNYGGTVTGGGTYNSNTTVTVIAVPGSGYAFVNWTEFGTEVSTSDTYSFDIAADRTLVANFTASAATATFDFDTGMPPVFPGQSMPASQWNNGLTAYFSTLAGGWSVQHTFYGWVPGVFSGNFLYPSTWGSTLAIEFNQAITNISIAFFTGDVSSDYDIPTKVRITAYTNSAMTSPVASATGQGDWLTGAYPEGTMSLSSATPFTKAKIDMPSGQGTVSYIYFLDNIVAQQVVQPPVTITATASPLNGGTVTGAGTVANGAAVNLVAAPNAGYDFVNWSENSVPVCLTPTYNFAATTNRTLIANFVQLPPTFAVITSALPSNGGTTTGDGIYAEGASASIGATHNRGYAFVNWTENDALVSSSETYDFTVLTNRMLVANFVEIVIPRLEICPTANGVVLSWPTNSTGFTVERTIDVGAINWTSVAAPITVVGTNYQTLISPLTGSEFFRLTHP